MLRLYYSYIQLQLAKTSSINVSIIKSLRLKSNFIVHLANILILIILKPYYLCYVKHKNKNQLPKKKLDKMFILLQLCETPKIIQLLKCTQ